MNEVKSPSAGAVDSSDAIKALAEEVLRVLVVDDELGMRLGVERSLRDFTVPLPDINGTVRFDVETVGDGEAALAKISDACPDVLLLDFKLPGISGVEVLYRMAEEKRELLTIMITAYATLETAVEVTKQGAYDFLAKPFTPEELRATLRKAARHIVLQRQARKLAEEKRKVRFQFISVLAHELKAPLSAVEGYLYLMRDRTAGNELSAYDGTVGRSLARIEGMRKLIADLLDLTRIEAGTRRRELKPVNLREAAAASVEVVSAFAAERDVKMELRVPPALTLAADREEVDIIFNNLFSNAVKYNRQGGRVAIDIAEVGEMIRIEVADTGIGMTAEESSRLFGEFVRIKNEKTKNIPGSGLGLSILKKLAMLYGGDASVKSVPDVGTTFVVTLRK
jgi:hypothetical protein